MSLINGIRERLECDLGVYHSRRPVGAVPVDNVEHYHVRIENRCHAYPNKLLASVPLQGWPL